jgi:hypothetical protein
MDIKRNGSAHKISEQTTPYRICQPLLIAGSCCWFLESNVLCILYTSCIRYVVIAKHLIVQPQSKLTLFDVNPISASSTTFFAITPSYFSISFIGEINSTRPSHKDHLRQE